MFNTKKIGRDLFNLDNLLYPENDLSKFRIEHKKYNNNNNNNYDLSCQELLTIMITKVIMDRIYNWTDDQIVVLGKEAGKANYFKPWLDSFYQSLMMTDLADPSR